MDISLAAMLPPRSEELLMNELAGLTTEFAPRRLALCTLTPERDDAAIIGWGMAFEDEVLVYLPYQVTGTRSFAVFPSPESAVKRLSRRADLRLVWVDSRPAAK